VISASSPKILCVQVARGKTHDFALFKGSHLPLATGIELLADTGYQGVDKLHANSQTPHKKSKLHPLTKEQKQQNKRLATRRIVVEHTLRYLKRFRILKDTYRNRRKLFGLRLNLLAAIANLHL
jgi:IS5 family transposase